MDPTLPWYKSAIVRHQIVMIIVGGLGLFGVTTGIDWDATTAAVLAGIAAVVPIVTLLTRIFKPAPPLTEMAAIKLVEVNKELAATQT